MRPIQTKETVKHASNAFRAMAVSFINTVAALWEKVGGDVREVAEAMGTKARTGFRFPPGRGGGTRRLALPEGRRRMHSACRVERSGRGRAARGGVRP